MLVIQHLIQDLVILGLILPETVMMLQLVIHLGHTLLKILHLILMGGQILDISLQYQIQDQKLLVM
jgi:hypothetical protein